MYKKIKINIFICVFTFLVGLNAQEVLNIPKPLSVKRLNKLDSPNREVNFSLSPDGNFLYFMSDRGGQVWSQKYGTYKGIDRYDGDIWVSNKIKGEWQKPFVLRGINNSSGQDEPNIMPDGFTMFYQDWADGWEKNGGPYYRAVLSNYVWVRKEGLGDSITLFFIDKFKQKDYYATDGMAISSDQRIFLVCCGFDYEGDMDIYISFYNPKTKKWTYPKLMNISTPKNERCVKLAPDNKTLFFASDGYNGYGGLDIYTCQLDEKGNCNNVKNIGPEINTAADEYSLVVDHTGKYAIFVRNDDIYEMVFTENVFNLEKTILIKGKIARCQNISIKKIEVYSNNELRQVINIDSDLDFNIILPANTLSFEIKYYYTTINGLNYRTKKFYIPKGSEEATIVINACENVKSARPSN